VKTPRSYVGFALDEIARRRLKRARLAARISHLLDERVGEVVALDEERTLRELKRRIRIQVLARQVLVALYSCQDCGAPAGRECGCETKMRRPADEIEGVVV
jgi:hypothetical protein